MATRPTHPKLPTASGSGHLGGENLLDPSVVTRQRPRFSACVPDAPGASCCFLTCPSKADLMALGQQEEKRKKPPHCLRGRRAPPVGLGESWASSWEVAAPPLLLGVAGGPWHPLTCTCITPICPPSLVTAFPACVLCLCPHAALSSRPQSRNPGPTLRRDDFILTPPQLTFPNKVTIRGSRRTRILGRHRQPTMVDIMPRP